MKPRAAVLRVEIRLPHATPSELARLVRALADGLENAELGDRMWSIRSRWGDIVGFAQLLEEPAP